MAAVVVGSRHGDLVVDDVTGLPVTVFVNVQVTDSLGCERQRQAVARSCAVAVDAVDRRRLTVADLVHEDSAASSVTESTVDVFFTATVYLTGPPGSGTLVGDGVFVTSIDDGTSVIATFAVSVSVTALPSSSLPVAVTVSVSDAPALPVNVP